MTTTGELDIVHRLLTDKPSFHQSGAARWDALPKTLEAIGRLARHGARTVEVGVGASTVVFAACGTDHTAISPVSDEHQRVRDYCQRIGIDASRVSFIVGQSDDVLPSLWGHDRVLDAAFIDGEHEFPFPVIDWYYITRSLKADGRLLVDDIPIPAVAQVFRHLRLESNWRLDGVFDGRAAAFTLLAPLGPGDWTRQAVNSGYPDFSFADLPERMRLRAAHRVGQIRHGAGEHLPALRRIYKRLVLPL
jgi:Methyltransferase domain